MRQPLAHRGPDSSGTWISPDRRTALAATRLAVRDVRSIANQPFTSDLGTTVYNGELYSWPAEFMPREGARTLGDTEVIHTLTCKDAALLKRAAGMYAVATWRAATKSLVLARDPAGEKPLYLVRNRRWIAFASEIKALVAVNLLEPELDRDAVAMLLRLGHVPDSFTIYKGAELLAAGTILEIQPDGREAPQSWWPAPAMDRAMLQPGNLRETIITAVRQASVADVPTGIFLSGGIDSSVIAAAARAGGCDLTALTLTSSDVAIDESTVAASTARHLGLPHEVVTVTADEARSELAGFFQAMDQPTVDGFNSYLISKAARSAGLTVALSGLGGDELFRGYPSFPRMDTARWLRRLPSRRALLRWAKVLEARQERSSDLLFAENNLESYLAIRGVLGTPRIERLLGVTPDWNGLLDRLGLDVSGEAGDRATSLLETREYMRSQLLRDLDVFSMASSLEVRAPLLYPSVIAIGNALPNDPRLRAKQLLKDAFHADLPAELFEHPKRGFLLPWEQWLKGSLRESSLDSIRDIAATELVLDPVEARRLFTDFEKGRLHWSGLWVVLALCHWAEVRRGRGSVAEALNSI